MRLHSLRALVALAALPSVAQVHNAPTSPQVVTNLSHYSNATGQGGPDGNPWSGYAVTGKPGSVTDVKGSWIIPTLKCNGTSTAKSAVFVGIDGDQDGNETVQQIGTQSDCVDGVSIPLAFWEFYPDKAIPIDMDVHSGDRISARVICNPATKNCTLRLTDQRLRKKFSKTGRASKGKPQLSSAEWIVELLDPYPLADFGEVLFGQANTLVKDTCVATIGGQTKSIKDFKDKMALSFKNNLGYAFPSALWDAPAPDVGSSLSVVYADPYAVAVLQDNPVAYYRLGEASTSDSDTIDSSGAGNSGGYENGPVLGQQPLIANTTDTSVNFAATGDVVISDAADLNFVNAPFTIEAWVNGPYSSFPTFGRVFDKITAGYIDGYGLDLGATGVRLLGCTDFEPPTPLTDNTTYHIVGVSDGAGNGYIYVNGQLVASGAYSSCQPYTGAAHIAVASDGTTAHFDGVIDEVAVYNYALSEQRILAHYHRGISPPE
jgi:hypothetical protein